MAKINQDLENDLAQVINRYIDDHGLHPQDAAATMNNMTMDFLDHLSWKPQDVQCAEIYLKEAQSWLLNNCGRPVLSHDNEDGDRSVLNSLVGDNCDPNQMLLEVSSEIALAVIPENHQSEHANALRATAREAVREAFNHAKAGQIIKSLENYTEPEF